MWIRSLILLTAADWLIPNHYPPWSTTWNDAVAITGLLSVLLLLTLTTRRIVRVSWQLLVGTALCWIVIASQLATGKLLYAGDALTAALYVGLWLAAVLAGNWMATASNQGNTALDVLAGAWTFAAIASVGIALVQWTGTINLGIYGADLPPDARPFANVGQPNHFCTLSFVGLCGLLWLREKQRVAGAVFWLAAGFLLLGMVMSQSRTGWLQVGLLVAWGLAMRSRAALHISRKQLLALGALFAAGVLLWPLVNDALLLSAGRSLDDQMRAGLRLPYWRDMLDAISRQPWWGYGWQQVGSAQQAVALAHPPLGVYFEHSHDFILDLLLWNGIPIGLLIAGLLAWWALAHVHACRDARAVWMLAAAGGVVTHGLLEYPLEYAYFLIPVGLAMGAVEVFAPTDGKTLRVPRAAVLTFTLVLAAVGVGVVSDYAKVEQNYRIQRFELAHIGTDRVHTPAPKLHLLTQLQAFLQIAHVEPERDMRPEQLDAMHRRVLRFGTQLALRRYAVALALNGHPEEAVQELLILRSMWGERAYAIAKDYVTSLADGPYPELRQLELP